MIDRFLHSLLGAFLGSLIALGALWWCTDAINWTSWGPAPACVASSPSLGASRSSSGSRKSGGGAEWPPTAVTSASRERGECCFSTTRDNAIDLASEGPMG